MEDRGRHEKDTLMAELASLHHEMMGASEDEIEQRMRDGYSGAVLVREGGNEAVR